MSVTYLDSSAIVKLAIAEPESAAFRRHVRPRRPLVSSALARTEVLRALRPAGPAATAAGHAVLSKLELLRLNDLVLSDAAELEPIECGHSTPSISPRRAASVPSWASSSRTTTVCELQPVSSGCAPRPPRRTLGNRMTKAVDALDRLDDAALGPSRQRRCDAVV